MNFVKDARDVRIIINKFNGTHHQREYDVMDIGFCAWKTNQKSLHWYHIQNAYTNVSNIAKIVKSFWNLFKQYLPIYVLFAGVEVLLVALSKTSQLKILQKKMTIFSIKTWLQLYCKAIFLKNLKKYLFKLN